jgi:predicted MFS family arabinose efflux permease
MLDRTGISQSHQQGEAARGLARPSMLAPFHVASFRFQWPADLLTSWAFEMETLILGWYVLVETGSVLWLTVFGALQYFGTLIAPMMGVTSDRIGHRNLLIGMRAIYALLAATLMTFAFAGAVTPTIVLIIAALTGAVRPSDLGVRSALVAETMASDRLIAAMSIARTTTDSARIAGALAGAGAFAAFGMGPAYVVVTSFYVLGSLLLLPIAPPSRHISLALAPDSSSPWHDLKDGVAQVWNTPTLLAVVWLAFLANLTAFPILNGLLPYVARDVYGLDQTGLGTLVAGFAAGALLGSIALSRIGAGVQLPRLMIVSTFLWYALLLVFAQMRGPLGGLLSLVLVGIGQSLSMVPLSIILLRAAGEKFRGRVMGVRMMAIYSLPIGLLAGGVLIGWIGFRAMASLYAVIGLVFTLIIVLRWRAQLWRRS